MSRYFWIFNQAVDGYIQELCGVFWLTKNRSFTSKINCIYKMYIKLWYLLADVTSFVLIRPLLTAALKNIVTTF